MKATVLVLLVVLGVAVVLSIPTGTAAALEPTPHPTVCATDAHMWFSIRMSLVRWLGGTPVVTSRDLARAQAEGWWGEPVVVKQDEVRDTR